VHLCNDVMLFSGHSRKHLKLIHAVEVASITVKATTGKPAEFSLTGTTSTSVTHVSTNLFSFGGSAAIHAPVNVSLALVCESAAECKSWVEAINKAARALQTRAASGRFAAVTMSSNSGSAGISALKSSNNINAVSPNNAGTASVPSSAVSGAATKMLGPRAALAEEYLQAELISLESFRTIMDRVLKPVQQFATSSSTKKLTKVGSFRGALHFSTNLGSVGGGTAKTEHMMKRLSNSAVADKVHEGDVQLLLKTFELILGSYAEFLDSFKNICVSCQWR
jgi:hypothetical protein